MAQWLNGSMAQWLNGSMAQRLIELKRVTGNTQAIFRVESKNLNKVIGSPDVQSLNAKRGANSVR
jgi:NACalpha-BTF3-like transcription factor